MHKTNATMLAHKRRSRPRGETVPRGTSRPRLLVQKTTRVDPNDARDRTASHALPPVERQTHPPGSRLFPAFMYEPHPGRALSTGNLSRDQSLLSIAELPRLVAEVGPKVAARESMRTEGSRMMASALGVHIPVDSVSPEEPPLESVQDENVSQERATDHSSDGKNARPRLKTLTGMEVVEILAKKRHLGKLQFVHLKVVEGHLYRPYDLRVVPCSQAGSEYYVFSPTRVLQVRDGCSVGLVTLAEWHWEAVLWRALQDIPFFRNYLLRKAFTRWHSNVRKVALHRKCDFLQEQLLMAVPQFRDALIQVSRLISELKTVHWLPQDSYQTCTLLEFQNALWQKNQESRGLLRRFLQYRALVLNVVRDDSYVAHKDLQVRVGQSQRSQCSQRSQPLHLQLSQLHSLRRELARAEHVLQRLGNMAALVDHMIVQSVFSIVCHEVTSFVDNVVRRDRPEQVSLFQALLVFGAEGQLTLCPPAHLFQEVLHGALLSVADSALQVFDSCSYSSDSSECMKRMSTCVPPSGTQDLTSDPNLACTSGVSGATGPGDELPSLVLPKLGHLEVEGKRWRGQYYPLSGRQLEWLLSLSGRPQEAQREQAAITQMAMLEVQQLCEDHSWLADIYMFTSQWDQASLEAMRGWPSLRFEEHIHRVRGWAERLRMMPDSITTSNKLLTVHCSHAREKTAPLLSSIEEEVLTLMASEMEQRSEGLASELRKAIDGLRAEPTDFYHFAQYIDTVKRCEEMVLSLQLQMDHLHSLQDTVRRNDRPLTSKETQLEKQLLDLWDQFQLLLKRAADTVRQRLPSMANTLDSNLSSLTQELHDLVSVATSGPYLEPTQKASLMVAQLRSMCQQVNAVAGRLKELNRISESESLGGRPLNLSFVESAKLKVEAQKSLWELHCVSTTQIQEWKLTLFCKFAVPQAQTRVEMWLQQAGALARTVRPGNAVLEATVVLLEGFGCQLPVLAKLSSPMLKHKHWRIIFKGMGLLYPLQCNLTVALLMSQKLLEHQNMISKICREAEAEADMRQAFRKKERDWEGSLFCLANYIVTVRQKGEPLAGSTRKKAPASSHRARHAQYPCDSGTFTIVGLETLLAQAEDTVTTLSNMLLSPHVVEFRQEVEQWVLLLQELEELLDFWGRYQQKWIFLSKIFYETEVGLQKPGLVQRFRPVDETYRELMDVTLGDPHVLNIVRPSQSRDAHGCFCGPGLHILFTEGLSAMEGISNQLQNLLDVPRREFPRLCFLSNGEVIELLSLHPTPSALLPLVRKCFRGVRWLVVDDDEPDEMDSASGLELTDPQPRVLGVLGSLGELVSFLQPLEPYLEPLAWLGQLEQKMQATMVHLVRECTAARRLTETTEGDGESGCATSARPRRPSTPGEHTVGAHQPALSLWDIISSFPLQCVLVAEEVQWCRKVQRAFLTLTPAKRNHLKAQNATQLQGLCQMIRDCSVGLQDSRRMEMALRALVLLTMKHSDQISGLLGLKSILSSSFEWQRLMKYHLSDGDHISQNAFSCVQANYGLKEDHNCYVEILGSRLPYGYEYLSPEHWMMVSTLSSERAILGVLFALTSFRCGFVSGPSMSGKRKTVAHLGRALGQQVITLHCCREMSLKVILQMLIGALQTGAWLVLDSVDYLTQGTLSHLGQHLSDIHQALSILKSNLSSPNNIEICSPSSDSREPPRIDCPKFNEQDCWGHVSLAGKSVLAKLGYGCVIISSGRRASEVPENLRVATRPVSLFQPDYQVIAEASLAALGFTEAASLSRQMVSLLSLAKDSLCFPESVSGSGTSWLVLLKDVIAAAGMHLHHACNVELIKEGKVAISKQGEQKQLLSLDIRPKEPEGGAKGAHLKPSKQSAALWQATIEEQAVVKAMASVVQCAILDPNKASHFWTLLEDMLQGAHGLRPTQFTEGAELATLSAAVTEELQDVGLHADPGLLRNVLSLYQALKERQSVLLVGQAGSGKTACYRALAGALRKLEARAEEAQFTQEPHGEARASEKQKPTPMSFSWRSVDTIVIFPNALSHTELWGGCSEDQGSWRDGAFTKVVRDSERQDFSSTARASTTESGKCHQARKVKWLVLDGDPLSSPSWLDPLAALCDPDDPFLCLSTGEKVSPSREALKLLVEVTSLEEASPSAVTRCGLVYQSGKDLWKAVWKSELETLYREHTLEQGTLKMWSGLAKDLFGSTLTFLRHKAMNPVLAKRGDGAGKSSKGIVYGLQEVTSFSRILHAFLEQFKKSKGMTSTPRPTEGTHTGLQHSCSEPLTPSTQQVLQAQNIFLVAYIWGFGGHLPPRHWQQFDAFVRKALYECRYKVEVPAEGTVFEHFVSLSDRPLGETGTSFSSSRNWSPKIPYNTIPQYKRYTYLLGLMLEARQPVLLVGEPASGKTTLCRSLLTQERPHLRLPSSPCLRSAHLRNVLENMGCQKTQLGTTGANVGQHGLLLFLDDLHSAPCDVSRGTSMALETLRQSMSRGGVLTSDGYHFKLFYSGAVNYLATCSSSDTEGRGYAGVIPRLSRLFSTFVLPSLSGDLLFSIHFPLLQPWLKGFHALPRHADWAGCVVTATLDLYHAVHKRFPPSAERPHFLFSWHDLHKVFQGMCLWGPQSLSRQPFPEALSSFLQASQSSSDLSPLTKAALGPVANMLSIVRLWMHESLRVFGDRLCSAEESQTLVSLLAQVSERAFSSLVSSQPSETVERDEPENAYPTLVSARLYPKKRHSPMHRCRKGDGKVLPNERAAAAVVADADSEDTEVSSDGRSSSSSSPSDWRSGSEENPASEVSSEPEDGPGEFQPAQDLDGTSNTTRTLLTLRSSGSSEQFGQSPQIAETGSGARMEQSPGPYTMPLQLLRGMEATIGDAVFSTELCKPPCSLSQQQDFRRNSLYMERDLGALMQQLATTVRCEEEEEEEEEQLHSASGYVVHGQGVHRLAHILRALLVPGGHGALFGTTRCSGRKTTVRLAAHITGYRLLELHAGNQAVVREKLREAGAQAGLQGAHVVLLVHQDVSQAVRDELLLLMADGTFPGLYSTEELENIVQKVKRQVRNLRNCLPDELRLAKYFQQVQRNMHVFLLLPLDPSGSLGGAAGLSLGAGGSIARILSLCCCVEVYQPWTTQCLTEVATRCLKYKLQLPSLTTRVDRTSLLASISWAMGKIHQLATRRASILIPDLHHFGPKAYMEFIAIFFHLCRHLYEQGQDQANRLATILGRVKGMADQADQYCREAKTLSTEFTKTHKDQQELQRAAEVERVLSDRAQQLCLLEKNRLAQLEEQMQHLQQLSTDAFQQVSPLYQTSLDTVQSLSQSDIEEVRHYRHPPEGVIIVMDTICMLFNRPCNWESSRQLLGQPNFLQELVFYDHSKVNDKLYEALGQAVQQPNFQPEVAREASRACEPLCLWVRAVYQFARVQRHLAPLGDQLAQLEGRVADSRRRLTQLQGELARQQVEGTEQQLQKVRQEAESLAARLRQAESREREAAAVMQRVEPSISRWRAEEKKTALDNQTIPGDALILAATITYLGPFGPDVRAELLAEWRELCLSVERDTDPLGPQTPPLGPVTHVPIPVAEELQVPLSRAMGVVGGTLKHALPRLLLELILWGYRGVCVQCCPLMADIQQRYNIGPQGMQATAAKLPAEEPRFHYGLGGYDLVVRADDPAVLDKVKLGAKKGQTVLMTHMERAVPSPEFLELLIRPTRAQSRGLARSTLAAHPGFCLCLCTALPVQTLQTEIHPSILAEVQVIDLSLSAAEMQEVVLLELVQSEGPELWMQHCQMELERRALLDKLHQEEASLMEYVLQSFSPLLQDPQFVPRVSASQTTVSGLRAELVELTQELEQHESLLADFRQVAGLASALYRALQEVARLSALYLFPLWAFLQDVKGALVLKGAATSGMAMAEIGHRLVSQLLAHYHLRLFRDHAAVLRLLACVALYQHTQGCSEAERVAFLRGLRDEGCPNAIPSPSSPSRWVPPHVQSKVLLLETLPPFRGLASSLEARPEQWQEYLRFPSSTVVGPVPCRSHAHLTTLQRALLWKTLMPHWLAAVANDLTACQLGQTARTPQPSTPEALSRILDGTEGPVVLVLPGPDEPGPSHVDPLIWVAQAAQCQTERRGKIIQVVTFGGQEHQKEALLETLDMAVQEGHWMVFNNCHLLEKWDKDVLHRLTELLSYAAKGHLTDEDAEKGVDTAGDYRGRQVQPLFRLWFITRAHAPLSLPAAVRMCAVRLVCDTPWDLKEALCYSLRLAMHSPLPPENAVEPFLRCAVLHAVLVQRQAFRHLGQGDLYSWTQQDLLALLDIHTRITRFCSDPVQALEYIAASLVYGGHVQDSADLDVVEGMARACLRRPAPQWGSGPHILSDVISNVGRFGLPAQLQELEDCVQALPQSDDPLVLGFSAGLAGELVKLQSHSLGLLLRQSQHATRRGFSGRTRATGHPKELPDLRQAHHRLQALLESMGRRNGHRVAGVSVSSQSHLHNFLQQEWDSLTESVSSLLEDITQPPSPALTLPALSRLESRVDLLRAYLWKESPESPPYTYRLSAFLNPRGFLAALLREAAQAKQRDVRHISLHFQVLSATTLPSSLPHSGAYLCGLELQGALWDTHQGALQDTVSHKSCPFPIIWVGAQEQASDSARSTDRPLLIPAPPPPLYGCPLYLDMLCGEGDWALAEGNIVTRVPLLTKLDPMLCALRRVRLVSTL